MANLTKVPKSRVLASPTEDLFKAGQRYLGAQKSPATQRAYNLAWKNYLAWIQAQNSRRKPDAKLSSLPTTPETLAMYLAELGKAGRKAASIELILVAISQMHEEKGLQSPRSAPVVRGMLKGIKRIHGTSQTQKSPLLPEHVRKIVKTVRDSARARRDKALLALGLCLGSRRSELVSLNVEDLEFQERALIVTLKRSKTDQEGHGRKIGVMRDPDKTICPVELVRKWLETAELKKGPIFLGLNWQNTLSEKRLDGRDVARIVKKYAAQIGLDPKLYSGHSLRAGLVTAAHRNKAAKTNIGKQTGHKGDKMIDRYIRDAEILVNNVTEGLMSS
jgi:integrase